MNRSLSQNSVSYPYSYKNMTLCDVILQRRPTKPLYILFPQIIQKYAQNFISLFPGKTLYSTKTNTDINVIKTLGNAGIKAYDVASLSEIKLIKSIFPKAELHFMHTIKTPEDIRAAYFDYGVKNFVLDHEDELFKIMRETELAQDLNLTIRVALPKNNTALIDFSNKFGAEFTKAADLLEKCRPISKKLGISFHIGSQSTDPSKYTQAIAHCAKLIKTSNIRIDCLNIGGGFPVSYNKDEKIYSIKHYMDSIKDALNYHNLSHLSILSEPGRALVAQGIKLVTRIELRKDNLLYINDGIYGGLFDAAKWVGTSYPVSAISCDTDFDGKTQEFRLAGPTCDSLDMMDGSFILPADINMGDWIIFDNIGSYSQVLRSDFNGFGHADLIIME